jgi:hypothetical protein
MRAQWTAGVVLAVLVSACGPRDGRSPAADSAAAAAPVDTAAGTPGDTASPPRTAMAMLPGLQAHLDSLAAHPAMLHGEMAAHQAKIKAVVAAMHQDMIAIGMHSDAAYEALADSVVRGSAALGTASGKAFDRLVMEHVDQMRRLAQVYETKAGAM